MNIEQLNCLTEDIAVIPKYVPNPKFRCIKAYYAQDNDVVIVGEADPNFIYWLSVTKTDDTETNRQIVAYLKQAEPKLYGHDSTVTDKKTKYTYEQLTSFYTVKITSAEEILTKYQGAKHAAGQNADKALITKMKQQLAILSKCDPDPIKDYDKKEKLIKQIQSQSALRLSDNPKVRELYMELDKRCSDIYNEYMTIAR